MSRWLMALLALPLTALAATVGAPAAGETGVVPSAANAAVAPAPAVSAGSGMAGQLSQLLLGLVVVLAVIVALAWVVRRIQQAAPRGNQVIDIVSARALGPRDRLVLVQVGDEQVLIGVSPGRISTLHVMKEPVRGPVRGEQATPEFAQRLMELLGKEQKDKK
jgi:flagellar protein FliO/FliZ